MNIAVFASSFSPHLGGVEELVRRLALELRDRGHSALVVTNRWPPGLSARDEVDGIPVRRYPMRGYEGSLATRARYVASHRRIRRTIARDLRKFAADIVHVQCVSTNAHYAMSAAADLRLPLIVTSQGERTMDAEDAYSTSPFLNETLRRVLRRATHVTACSRDTLEDLERFLGEPLGPRGTTILNGVEVAEIADPAIAPFPHPRPFVLAIGRWVPQKGFDVLLEAFALALQEPGFDLDLILAGEGPERPRYEALVQHLGLDARVRLLGRADRPTAVSLFRGCTFFVLPSRHEPFGIVNVEAMAAARAVVATAVGGVPEIVRDGHNGLLVAPEDPGALANALKRVAGDENLRRQLGERGRCRAAELDWSRIADRYVSVYSAALSGA